LVVDIHLNREGVMADYMQDGNRWTAIYLVVNGRGGNLTYRKLPFELVRFNADVTPGAEAVIVPCGEDTLNPNGDKQNSDKIYEKIWIVDSLPYAAKTSFGAPE
jgi:hypothetical protein